MRGARPQGGPQNEIRPPNLYYDHGNARQTFHPPAGLQTANDYIPIQGRQGGSQNFDNRRQVPLTDPGPSNSQNVRFLNGVVESHHDDVLPLQMEMGEEQGQWPPHTNVITYELKSLGDEVTDEASALAVITRARRGKTPLEVGIEGQEEYSSDEVPNLSELDRVARVARRATRELEKENVILHDRERPNVIHDLEGSEMGEWERPGIPLDEFDGVGNAKVGKSSGYDLWTDLSSLKADIIFGQLLEISLMARKTTKEGMPVIRRTKKVKTRVSARVQMHKGRRDIKPIEIEVMVVDKVIPNVLVDGGSGLNILPEHIMKKLGLSLTGLSLFIINMANQSPAVPLGMIKDCRISTRGKEYVVTFHVIKIHSNKDTFLLLLGRPWLRMSDTIVDWGGIKPSITYGPEDNRVKVLIGSLGG